MESEIFRWKLNFNDFLNLTQQNCFYCKSPPSNIWKCTGKTRSKYAKKHGTFIYNGLDKIDNDKKHDIENVVACCKICNYAKRKRTVKEFIEWLKLIVANIKTIKELNES